MIRVLPEIKRQLEERPLTGRLRESNDELEAQAMRGGAASHGGAFIPNPYAQLAKYQMYLLRAGLDTATSTKGSELFFKQQADYIGPDYALGVLPIVGATIVPSDMPLDHVKQTATLSTAMDFSSENPGSDVTSSDFTMSLFQARPKEMIAAVKFSAQLLRFNTRTQYIATRELLRATSTKLETAAFNGSGSAPQPKGVLNISGTTTLAVGTNGGAVTSALLAHMPRAVGETGGVFPDSKLAYVTTPAVKTEAQQLPRGTGTESVWHSDADVYGYPGAVTPNVPNNLTKGTSTTVCHAVVFGDWAQLYLHVSPAIEIVVDPFTFKKQGLVELSSYFLADVAIPRAASFCVLKDVTVPAL
jgi:hypothetical protein